MNDYTPQQTLGNKIMEFFTLQDTPHPLPNEKFIRFAVSRFIPMGFALAALNLCLFMFIKPLGIMPVAAFEFIFSLLFIVAMFLLIAGDKAEVTYHIELEELDARRQNNMFTPNRAIKQHE